MAIDSDKKSKKKNKMKAESEHKRKLEDTEERPAVVETKKDKKKKKREEALSGGSVLNGSDEKVSSKKIKKDNQEEGEKIDGSVQDCDGEVRESIEGVVVSGKDVNESKFRPLKSFVEAGLPDEVLECCKTFNKPSPIQANSWRFLLGGRDFIGIAKTGSGS